MADLNGEASPMPEITCDQCEWRGAPAILCPECGGDLPDSTMPPIPRTPPEPETPQTPIELVVHSTGRLRLLPGQRIGLGRHDDYPAAAVFAPYDNISRFHGELRYDGERLFITDTSTNGTFVNGIRIPQNHEHEIGRGDTLRLAADVPITIEWGR